MVEGLVRQRGSSSHGRSGGASYGLGRDSLVRLGDDLAGRLEVPELRIEGASPIRDNCFIIAGQIEIAK